ncbi:peptide deformylase, mitochondrial-like [Centruroides sculpturatus]|uniref:peptide deformylase, mitochondrial-like n=1 Tax=Centruroides sculpturatus TaxID=218467 RepID=UPI000C6E4416|nr:peptide deformylase, mitochondrial-like [Centruroides sculpturatus]
MSSKLPKAFISRFLQWYSSLWPIPYPKPPYEHICPIGDQNLRCKAQSVDVNAINSAEIQTVFINPTLSVINNRKINFPEGCACIKGYSAIVPRCYEIKVKAYNELGEPFEVQTKGWTSRIIQHEMDHLKGQLYVDIMDSRTFQFDMWEIVNKRKGKIPWLQLKYI